MDVRRSGWMRGRNLRIPVPVWWAGALGWAVAGLVLLLLLHGFYRRELNHFTGDAQWMWVTDELHDPVPTSGLFFHRLELSRRPRRAVAKICGDRQYVLWINGQPATAGRNRPGFRLDVVEVTDLLVSGENLITIEARSPTSVGGVLFALDLFVTEEARRGGDPYGRGCLVSGPGWRVAGTWGEGPDVFPGSGWSEPVIWGRPPDHPWTYPQPEIHRRTIVQAIVSDARPLEGCFTALENGEWVCRLEGEWAGFLALRLGDAPGPERIGTAGSGASPDTVDVVTLEGQREWLFPGRLQGSLIFAESHEPPAGVVLFDALE